MHPYRLILFITLVTLSFNLFAQDGEYGDPTRFEEAILAFEAADTEEFPEPGGIVAIGSSSIRMWKTIHEDLAPHTIIHRGFGGSNMNDALHYLDRIVLPYKPKAIMLYEGDNDIGQGIAPYKIADKFRELTKKLHKALPECGVYFIAIKPSVRRAEMLADMALANALIRNQIDADDRMHYLDIFTPMLNEKAEPEPSIFIEDMLHMNEAGYAIWKDVIAPFLNKQ